MAPADEWERQLYGERASRLARAFLHTAHRHRQRHFFGLAPALQSIRVAITPALKETRASESHGKARRFGLRFGLSQALVVGQIGISLLLVVAAGLFVRTIANLHSVNLGFNSENLLIFTLDATQAGYQDASLKQCYKELEQRFQAIPCAAPPAAICR